MAAVALRKGTVGLQQPAPTSLQTNTQQATRLLPTAAQPLPLMAAEVCCMGGAAKTLACRPTHTHHSAPQLLPLTLTAAEVRLHGWVAQRRCVEMDGGPAAPALAPPHWFHIEKVGPAHARLAVSVGLRQRRGREQRARWHEARLQTHAS